MAKHVGRLSNICRTEKSILANLVLLNLRTNCKEMSTSSSCLLLHYINLGWHLKACEEEIYLTHIQMVDIKISFSCSQDVNVLRHAVNVQHNLTLDIIARHAHIKISISSTKQALITYLSDKIMNAWFKVHFCCQQKLNHSKLNMGLFAFPTSQGLQIIKMVNIKTSKSHWS